jgi:aminopeptidase N
VSFDLRIIVPNLNWRFGRIGSMALLGNAIPVLAIHDALGWHLEPYTSNGESFYSQVSDFTVTLTAPKSLAVPATGVTIGSSTHRGRTTRTFEADGVRDFAWASGPLSEEGATAPTGVLVKVWWPSAITKTQADGMLALATSAMASHAAAYGAYPYAEVDVVLGIFTRFGGMEYPQFIMTDVSNGALVHELAHQWWFGVVGDDEYTEPWLDEAFASYATDLFFGDSGGGCGTPNWPSGTARITNSMAYWDAHPSEYGTVVYGIGSCALHVLAATLGASVMAGFLHDYAVEHALGWSTTDAFKVEAQAVADGLPNPIDLTPFWETYRIDDVP